MSGRRMRRVVLFAGVVLLAAHLALGAVLSRWAERRVRAQLPPEAAIGSVRWSWPVGLVIREFLLPDSAGRHPYRVKIKEARFQAPVWGIWIRPVPVKISLRDPHVQMHSEDVAPLLDAIGARPPEWFPVPLWENSGDEDGTPQEAAGDIGTAFPFVPFSIRITGGRLDAWEEMLSSGRPVFSVADVKAEIGLVNVFTNPAVRLSGDGRFVSEAGAGVGLASVSGEFTPQRRAGRGSLRLRYERMEDFRNLYQYAPSPILIEGGMADATVEGELTEGSRIRMTAHCLVQGLDLVGRVRDVPWADILRAVEDDQRRYEWTVEVEGDLRQPHFNPHDRILREVEYRMKEKAASRGLRIEGDLFFYSDVL